MPGNQDRKPEKFVDKRWVTLRLTQPTNWESNNMEKAKAKVVIKKEREVNTYADMWRTSHYLLTRGIEDQKGCYYQFMASLVFTAFTLEAYFNHIGVQLFKCWSDLERLGPKEKLNVIAERLSVKIEYGKRPWQVMKHLFEFRNDIAHGKSQIIKRSKIVPHHKFSDMRLGEQVRTEWEKYCTKINAQNAREDVEAIINELHKIGQFKPSNPFFAGIQHHSAVYRHE